MNKTVKWKWKSKIGNSRVTYTLKNNQTEIPEMVNQIKPTSENSRRQAEYAQDNTEE